MSVNDVWTVSVVPPTIVCPAPAIRSSLLLSMPWFRHAGKRVQEEGYVAVVLLQRVDSWAHRGRRPDGTLISLRGSLFSVVGPCGRWSQLRGDGTVFD